MDWQGSVYARGERLWIRVKSGGAWRSIRTPYVVGQEDKARASIQQMRRGLTAAEAIGGNTVRIWGEKWISTRAGDQSHDRTRLALHIYPAIGGLALADVRPRHLLELVTRLRAELAPRTVRNVYSVVQALFRDAVIADLIETTPCILRRPHLPQIEDRDPEWRSGAVFSRRELERLITPCPEIEADSRVVYALLGLAMLRHGEMAGLRWRHWDPTTEPLGRLVVSCSYARRGTKTVLERWMPVHPRLAAELARWRLSGWPALMGRAPAADDWIVPLPPDARAPRERVRSKEHSHLRFRRHLAALELRHRRLHDLRRTGISLARQDGARADILRRGTHAPSREIIELYTSVEWELLCGQVGVLRLGGRARRRPATGRSSRSEG